MQVRSARCKHNLVVCTRCVVVTDAAKRMADHINAKVVFTPWDQLVNGYMAFRLDDGSSNGTLYDSKADAVRFTDEKRNAYFCFRQGIAGVNPRDCQIFLDVHRHAYANGGHLADPDLKRQSSLILSTKGYDVLTGRINPHVR
jgi:hypothetical protein